jgi:hypothetical protein
MRPGRSSGSGNYSPDDTRHRITDTIKLYPCR